MPDGNFYHCVYTSHFLETRRGPRKLKKKIKNWKDWSLKLNVQSSNGAFVKIKKNQSTHFSIF